MKTKVTYTLLRLDPTDYTTETFRGDCKLVDELAELAREAMTPTGTAYVRVAAHRSGLDSVLWEGWLTRPVDAERLVRYCTPTLA